jgi:hypothetical protein
MPWYLILDLIIWGITVGVVVWAWRRLEIKQRWVVSLTSFIVMVLQTLNEVLSFNLFEAWTFSLEHNRFIGLKFLDAPIEEYLFWFSFAWLLPFLYSGLCTIYNKNQNGI